MLHYLLVDFCIFRDQSMTFSDPKGNPIKKMTFVSFRQIWATADPRGLCQELLGLLHIVVHFSAAKVVT
jgi:hypothetical protein